MPVIKAIIQKALILRDEDDFLKRLWNYFFGIESYLSVLLNTWGDVLSVLRHIVLLVVHDGHNAIINLNIIKIRRGLGGYGAQKVHEKGDA